MDGPAYPPNPWEDLGGRKKHDCNSSSHIHVCGLGLVLVLVLVFKDERRRGIKRIEVMMQRKEREGQRVTER